MIQNREKAKYFLQAFPWADERFYYLQLSIQIVTVVSLICAAAEVIFGCWSLNILTTKVHYERVELSSSKSKHVTIGVAIFIVMSARITALIIWIRSTRNENLRCYSVTSHCTFLSVFIMLGLGCLLIYFLSIAIDLKTGVFRPNTEVLLAFSYVAGFDVLFSATFGFAVTSDLQCKIRREWEYAVSGGERSCEPRENWVRPCRVPKYRESQSPYSGRMQVHEVYV